MTSFPLRMLRAARLHADTYEEVEADRRSIGQATVVVFAAAFAGGVARWLTGARPWLPSDALEVQIVLSSIEPLVLWLGGSAFAYMVGSSFFRGPETETDFLEVLRTTGFAFTPGLLRVFAFLPPPALGLTIDLGAFVWQMVAIVVAIRQALDFTTGRAVGTFGFAALLMWLVVWGLTAAPIPFL